MKQTLIAILIVLASAIPLGIVTGHVNSKGLSFSEISINSTFINDNKAPSKQTKALIVKHANTVNVSIEAINITQNKLVQSQLKEIKQNYNTDRIDIKNGLLYVNSFIEQPLVYEDYYWGKYENARAGANGLNNMPTLSAGDSIGVISDGYIDINYQNGFIQPASGYYFASGVCWSTSAMGAMMDQANIDFRAKYGIDLFVFYYGDRGPHTHNYATYHNANNGWGYAIFQKSSRIPVQEYRFTINPQLLEIEELADLELKIVMLSSDNHNSAAYDKSIAAYLLSNKEF